MTQKQGGTMKRFQVALTFLLLCLSGKRGSASGIEKGSGHLPDRWRGYADASNGSLSAEFNVRASARTSDQAWRDYCRLDTRQIIMVRTEATLTLHTKSDGYRKYETRLVCFDKTSNQVSLLFQDENEKLF